MNRRRLSVLCAVLGVSVLLGGCGPTPPAGPDASESASPPVATATATASTGAPATATTPPAAALACADVRSASVYSPRAPYNLMGEAGLTLLDGLWTGPDGITVAVQTPCAVGTLVAGAGPSAVVALMSMTPGTTGRYWAMAICRRGSGRVLCTPVKYLDDREPIESIAVADMRITLVYLTRTPEVPPVGVNIRRTAIYTVAGDTVHEVSHTDASL